jgi:oxalate decarboxylase/phosphoglucose isomerase-like protein (cupin superfamily)
MISWAGGMRAALRVMSDGAAKARHMHAQQRDACYSVMDGESQVCVSVGRIRNSVLQFFEQTPKVVFVHRVQILRKSVREKPPICTKS